jgi:hypothetical protein
LQTGEVIHCVQKTIEEKAWDSGHVTGSHLKELLEYNGNQLKKIDERLIDVQQHLMDVIGNRGITAEGASMFVPGADNHREGNNDAVRTTFMHGGRFYDVPKDFEFPRNIALEPALFWLCGMSVSTDGLQRVRSFIKLSLSDLPEQIKSSFKLNWKGIFDFSMMMPLRWLIFRRLLCQTLRIKKFVRHTQDVLILCRNEFLTISIHQGM